MRELMLFREGCIQLIEGEDGSGRPSRPVERTLLTSGMLDFLLTSRLRGGAAVETPELALRYHSQSHWKDPGPPPPARPLDQQ